MIAGLCGFADLVRQHGGDVGSAELIDAARALALTDLTDRHAVHLALKVTFTWSTVHPELFDRLFDEWFSGRDLDAAATLAAEAENEPAIALDADAVDAARIHTEDATAIEAQHDGDDDATGGTGNQEPPLPADARAMPSLDDGAQVSATGSLAKAAPRDDMTDDAVRSGTTVVELPNEPLAADLELARNALVAAVEHRRRREVASVPRRVRALTEPLSATERLQLERFVRRLDRRLDGAPSWQRTRDYRGAIDVRRTLRRTVTTGGLPTELRYTGRRTNAARLVVLVDLSMSVRGTARLVLHLVHRMRSMVGSLRAFGFVDSCVSIDGALRIADPAVAIEHVLGLVDMDANSDPGRAFRQWWARWHHLVATTTHVIVLSDGRCNGRDPAFGVIDRIARRSASSLWVSPEPPGAWTLGRGEMATYADLVDRAVAVRSLEDLDQLVPPARSAALRRARRA